MTTKQSYEEIRKLDDFCGRLGFAISNSIEDYGNSYEDIGVGLDYVINKHPDEIELIEEVVIALSGYKFETLLKHMTEQKDYYDSL